MTRESFLKRTASVLEREEKDDHPLAILPEMPRGALLIKVRQLRVV
jgi:hypothetical protein